MVMQRRYRATDGWFICSEHGTAAALALRALCSMQSTLLPPEAGVLPVPGARSRGAFEVRLRLDVFFRFFEANEDGSEEDEPPELQGRWGKKELLLTVFLPSPIYFISSRVCISVKQMIETASEIS